MKPEKQIAEQYEHFVTEVFTYLEEYLENIVPAGRPDQEVYRKTKAMYEQLEALYGESGEHGEMKITPAAKGSPEGAAGTEVIASYLEDAMDYFEQSCLSEHAKDRRWCCNVILNTVQTIANLAVWMHCLYEDTATACYVKECLSLTDEWKIHCVHSGVELKSVKRIVKNTFQNPGNGV